MSLMATDNTFQRAERLKSPVVIARLFKEGQSFMAYPVRVVWMNMPAEDIEATFPVKVAFSVSKRVFKTAVVRNLLKRRMREAYRLHKADWYGLLQEAALPPIALMLIYVAKEPLPYKEIESGVRKMMRKLP
ncbi:MAG: ribonuclease P protein component [Saprospiraceae bacterium]